MRTLRLLAAPAWLALLVAMSGSALAAPVVVSPEVIHTGTGPTGYTVTFRYYDGNPATTNVKIRGEWYLSDAAHTTTTSSAGRLPSQFLPGDFPIANPNQGAAPNWPVIPMTQDPTTLVWSYTTPLPPGTWTYGFLTNCTNDTMNSTAGCPTSGEISDPDNPPWNTPVVPPASVEPTSQAYVPADTSFGTTDFSWQAPNPVHGTLADVTYPDPESTNPAGVHPLAVYLPPGYSPTRSVPYPTLYLSHGSGGNEIDWTTQGAAGNILDNLIAGGKLQPVVAVMTDFNGIPGGVAGYRNDVVNRVIPYVESHYNVSHNANDRAFAGLSAGGQRANDILFNTTTSFGYYGVWSIGTGGAPAASSPLWQNPDLKTRLALQSGGGLFDSITFPSTNTYLSLLTTNGVPFSTDFFDAGHEWYTWRQLLYDFSRTLLFRHTTTTASGPATSVYGQPATFTATVVNDTTEPAGPTGTVSFYLDGVVDAAHLLGTAPVDPSGHASVTVASISVGPHTIEAVYGGDSVYNGSTSATIPLTVGQAPLTVTADNQSRPFGSSNPPLTATLAGFVLGQTLATSDVSGSASCTTTAMPFSPGGGYPITCTAGSLASTNYSFGPFIPGTLTVTFSSPCITGHQNGSLKVQAGQSVCIGAGAQVSGSVTVAAGASLDIEGGTISGSLQVDGAGVIRICGAKLSGALKLSGSTGLVLVGGDAATGPCAGNTISGSVSITDGTGGVEFNGNKVTGSLTITGNTGSLPPPDTGSVHAAGNSVSGPVKIQP
jgi:enterochelin esterase-like enzyme